MGFELGGFGGDAGVVVGVAFGRGQEEGELGALVWLAGDVECAVVAAGHAEGSGEAEAASGEFGGVEGFEDSF